MKEQEQEQKQAAQQGGTSGASSPSATPNQFNPNYEPGGGGKALDETTTYYNDSYGPGENPNEGLGEKIQETLE